MKWYKRDPDRALAGMAELTLQQRGGYNSLLDLLYSRDGDLPDDDARVARMMQCHRSEWKAVKRQLMDLGKVWIEAGKLCANGVQTTLKEATNFSQTQRERVGKRWEKHEKYKQNNDPSIRDGNTNTTTTTTTTTEEEESKILAPAKAVAVRSKAPVGEPEGFAEFYQAYPRHIGRGQAAKAYRAALKRAAPGMILDSAVRFATAVDGSDVQFIAHPATWLNGDRWADDLTHQGGNRNGRQQSHDPAHGGARNSRFLQGIVLGLDALNDPGPGEESGGEPVDRSDGRALLQR